MQTVATTTNAQGRTRTRKLESYIIRNDTARQELTVILALLGDLAGYPRAPAEPSTNP